MRPDVSVPQDGSGQREGLLWPCLPRSRIPPEGGGWRSYPSPSPFFNSRRAAATSVSRIQLDRSPDPLR